MTMSPAAIRGFESKSATLAGVGMAHVFLANLALLEAAREALDIAGEFLRRNLAR